MSQSAGPGHALSVYSPEVFVSRLLPDLDAYLAEATGLEAGERFLIQHDAESIEAFYRLSGATSGRRWPLVIDLFEGRLACVTLWQGDSALPRLQAVKGAIQPARAAPDSVRGRFWCDNPVCNLLHVSDDPETMAAELRALRRRRVGPLDPAALRREAARPRHSALLELIRLLRRLLPPTEEERWRVLELPGDGNARATARAAIGRLRSMAAQLPRPLATMIASFLAGDAAFLRQAQRHLGRLTAWEALVLECGLHAAPLWLQRLGLEDEAAVVPVGVDGGVLK